MDWKYCECGCHGSEANVPGIGYVWMFDDLKGTIRTHKSHGMIGTRIANFSSHEEMNEYFLDRMKEAKKKIEEEERHQISVHPSTIFIDTFITPASKMKERAAQAKEVKEKEEKEKRIGLLNKLRSIVEPAFEKALEQDADHIVITLHDAEFSRQFVRETLEKVGYKITIESTKNNGLGLLETRNTEYMIKW